MRGPEAADKDTVRACVNDILASRTFSRSGRLRAFLGYVVERELEGKAGQLKGYTIGIDVFGRSSGFDAGSDPIVRVQAGKLRKLLDEYYDAEGATARLRIRIPVGSYAPEYLPLPPTSAAVGALSDRKHPFRRPSRLAAAGAFALLTLLTLFLLAPPADRHAAVPAIAGAAPSGQTESRETNSLLPSLHIEPCLGCSTGRRSLASAIERAAGHYRTVQLREDAGSPSAGPLSYTIRLETQRNGEAVYARLVHDESGDTVHAEHFHAGDLDDEVAVAYEAVAYAGRMLSATGRMYQHAAEMRMANAKMMCLQEADRQQLPIGSHLACLDTPAIQGITDPLEAASRGDDSQAGDAEALQLFRAL